MKPLSKHITESFQTVNEDKKSYQYLTNDQLDEYETKLKTSVLTAFIYLVKTLVGEDKFKQLGPKVDDELDEVYHKATKNNGMTTLNQVVKILKDNKFINESSENVDMIAMAIEYLIGQPIARYHDEANNYAYQLAKKNSTGWITISRKEVDDTVKMHGLSLNKMNESSNSIDKQIAYQESRINSAQKLHDEAKGTVDKKNSMRDLLDEQSKLAELKAYAKIHKDRQ